MQRQEIISSNQKIMILWNHSEGRLFNDRNYQTEPEIVRDG